jgi:histone chaperone ASF1
VHRSSERRFATARFPLFASLNAHFRLDLEWKLIFVSSPESEEYDQELDDCMVGPVPVGVNSFEFSAPSPDPRRIPPADVLGVAAVILTASYRDQEFVRVGYYQNTEYDNDEMKETPPEKIRWERLMRDLSNHPRVTRFSIKWCVSTPSFGVTTLTFLLVGIRTLKLHLRK